MTDYYKMKKQAYMEVADLYAKGVNIKEIKFKIAMQYGLGETFVDRNIELLQSLEIKKES